MINCFCNSRWFYTELRERVAERCRELFRTRVRLTGTWRKPGSPRAIGLPPVIVARLKIALNIMWDVFWSFERRIGRGEEELIRLPSCNACIFVNFNAATL